MCNSIIDQQEWNKYLIPHEWKGEVATPQPHLQPIKLTKEEWEKARESCRKNLSGLGVKYTPTNNNYRFSQMIESICKNPKPAIYYG